MKIIVVFNPMSGSSFSQGELQKLFKNAAITVEKYITLGPTLQSDLRPWRKKGIVIAVIGGDGTVGSVANIIHGSQAIIAPLPGGTLNHFTKDLGINQDMKRAINGIATATPRKIDVATVNGRLFLNNSSIGIYPLSLQTRKHFEDTMGKWTAAVIASVRAFIRFRVYEVTISGDTFQTPFVFIGNNFYDVAQGGERKRIDKRKLCIYAIKSNKRRTIVKLLFMALSGRLHDPNDLIFLSTQKVTITSKRKRIRVAADGELLQLETPLIYESLPGSLTIL